MNDNDKKSKGKVASGDETISVTVYDPHDEILPPASHVQTLYNHHGISMEYFDECNSMSKRLLNYVEGLNDDADFVKWVNDINGLESVDRIGDTGIINVRIFALFAYDLTKVFSQLGHKLRPESKEMLTLGLFMIRVIDHPDIIAYAHIDQIYERLMADATSFLRTIHNGTAPGLNSRYAFYMPKVFDLYEEPERKNQYMVLLYRFASVVAKADGTIDSTETEYLSGLKAKEEKKTIEKQVPAHSDPIAQLNSLIGLTGVKDEVSKLSNFIKIQQMRNEKGLKSSPISYHCVFTGNPGTGKTTVARIIAEIYRNLGILKKGHLVETDRSGLVAEYVGQTAVKTNKIIDSALDGVLFIDEAYSLVGGGNNDYGIEAIATLLKRMEDDRDRLVVVLAGYGDEMKTFINANPGLQSRFNRYIHFDDYDADQLIEIFKVNMAKNDYHLRAEAEAALRSTITHAVACKDRNFGNARYVRNLFEKTLENQATRLAALHTISTGQLQEIIAADIPATYTS